VSNLQQIPVQRSAGPSLKAFVTRIHKIAEATISIVKGVRPSVRMDQLGSYLKDFHEI
jgi:hypothetical protein